MRTLCQDIEAAIARGEVPAGAVMDLKAAIDETRMRVWASMEAARSGDPAWVQEFWLERAAEICSGVASRLDRGDVDPRSPRATQLRAAAADVAARLGADDPGPSPNSEPR
jgi:hypothetical protein